MKINYFLISLPFLWLGTTSCSDQNDLLQNVEEENTLVKSEEIEILNFSSGDNFRDCLYSLMGTNENDDVSTRNLSVNAVGTDLSLAASATLLEKQSLL